MRPTIKPQKNIYFFLRYNEHKVAQGKAIRLAAENFLKDANQLNQEEILSRFRQRSTFNEFPSDRGVHISINFGKSEELSKETLVQVSAKFMSGVGYEDQPYVVYQHFDAGHPHLHVVATDTRADGSWIDLAPRDYHVAHSLSRELEKEYSLENGRKAAIRDESLFAAEKAQRITYGEPGLTRAMSDVLNTVFSHYNYTSLDEYNAILRQYNLEANPGGENSRLHKLNGLLYHVLDAEGNHIGKPVKASTFLVKPTLPRLEQKFQENNTLRESARERLTTAIEWALAGRAPNWQGFMERLQKDGISVGIDKKQDAQRIFFVDHIAKSAFAGTSLGANYALETLRNRCAPEQKIDQQQSQEQQIKLRL